MRKWIVPALLVLALTLAACPAPAAPAPAADDADTTADTTDDAAADDAATDSGEEVALRWRTRPDNQEEIDVYQSISDQLDEQMTDIALAYEPGGSEDTSYQDVLRTEIAAGTAPDVFWIPGTDVADFAQRGLILNLADLADTSDDFSVDAFYPGPMDFLTYNPETNESGAESGALWGLPRDVSTFALYLNLDLINEAGAPDPRELAANGEWTWESFLDVAEQTSALGDDIFGYGANAWWAPYGVWMNSAGGGFFNEDRTACALDSEASLEGLAFAQSIYQEANVAVPYGEDSEPPFRAGNVAMFQNGRWGTPGVRTVDFNFDAVQLPEGPGGEMGNWLFWGAYAVNANTENPEAAWELVQMLTTAEVQGQIAELGANIPSRVSQEALDAFLTYTPPANNEAFLAGLSENPVSEGPLWQGNWPAYEQVMGPAVQAVLTGDQTVEEFAASICDEANRTFDQ